jgi:predicted enzyme related to lactoylglutathione lyase
MGNPVVHFEVIAKDADRAQSYYSDLFGSAAESARAPRATPGT